VSSGRRNRWATRRSASGARQDARGGGFIGAIYNCRKPSIVAFTDRRSAGAHADLADDIRIAAAGTKFGLVFAPRPGAEAAARGSCRSLSAQPSPLKWCLTGEMFRAEDALAAGLVSEVLPQDQVLARAKAIATRSRKRPRRCPSR